MVSEIPSQSTFEGGCELTPYTYRPIYCLGIEDFM